MTCGIICRLDPDGYSPWAELARIRAFVDSLPGVPAEPEPDWYDKFERWLCLFMAVVTVIAGIAILSLLAYGVITTVVAALS